VLVRPKCESRRGDRSRRIQSNNRTTSALHAIILLMEKHREKVPVLAPCVHAQIGLWFFDHTDLIGTKFILSLLSLPQVCTTVRKVLGNSRCRMLLQTAA
jgi:hypothetical protein